LSRRTQVFAKPGDYGDAAIRTRERKPQADHRRAAHPAPDVEIQGMIAAGPDIKRSRTKTGDDQDIAAIGE